MPIELRHGQIRSFETIIPAPNRMASWVLAYGNWQYGCLLPRVVIVVVVVVVVVISHHTFFP